MMFLNKFMSVNKSDS